MRVPTKSPRISYRCQNTGAGKGVHTVLMLTPLNENAGGIATWTRILLHRGLGERYRLEIVDTARSSPYQSSAFLGRASEHIARNVRIMKTFFTAVARNHPDLVHINCCLSPLGVVRDLLCATVARQYKARVVVHFHGDVTQFPFGALMGNGERALAHLASTADASIVLTTGSAEWIGRNHNRDNPLIAMIPNFVDDSLFAPFGSGRIAANTRPRCIFAGRVTEAKGVCDILAAAQHMSDVEFRLVGPVDPAIAHSIVTSSSNVVSIGQTPHGAVVDELRQADLFVLPSRREGCPMSLLEAMAQGLPVVATRVGDIPSLVSDTRGGLLLSVGDRRSLRIAIRRITSDRMLATRMGRFNRSNCDARYRYSIVSKQLIKFYDRVLEPPDSQANSPGGSRTLSGCGKG